jgi:hypothetical protein
VVQKQTIPERIAEQKKALLLYPHPHHQMGEGGTATHILMAEEKEGPSELKIKTEVLSQLTPNRLFQVFVLQQM